MKEKRKRKLKRGDSNAFWIIALLLVGILGLVAIAFLLLVTITSDESAGSDNASIMVSPAIETLIVPFDRAEATYTEFEYTGDVQLEISGTGQAAGNSYSDAFYLFTDENGAPRTPPATEMFDLEIDGERAIYQISGELPAYNPDHVYSVRYHIGTPARRIAFRISDDIVGDNSGAFTISVSQIEE